MQHNTVRRSLGIAGVLALGSIVIAYAQQLPPPPAFGASTPPPPPAAPTTTAFDGTYASVSRTLEGSAYGPGATTRLCWDSGVVAAPPGRLTIVNGFARWQGLVGTFEGSVSPQGVVVMRNPRGIRFDGGIDSKGTVTGRITGNCSYWMVWHKEGK